MGILIRSQVKITIFLFSAVILLILSNPLMAQERRSLQLQEQTIKAGLVYNFLKYTTWPSSYAGGQLRVCFYGGEPLDGNLSSLEGRTAQQATISIVRIGDIKKATECSVLFISPDSEDELPALLAFLKDKHVLTMSDMDEFARQGGMVELTTEDKRVTLYINQSAVGRAGLNIQGRLLKLAKLVQG